MSSTQSFSAVKELVSSVRRVTLFNEKMSFYDTWAQNYDRDLAILGYDVASQAARSVSSCFRGDREAALVLDVACGTGLVAEQMKRDGFRHFVGIDGNKAMLEEARKKELYRDLKQFFLGEETLPVPAGSCDVVMMCGALSIDNVSVRVLRQLSAACRTGGLVCMTCRHSPDNRDYRASLEEELGAMEAEGLWSRENVILVESWLKDGGRDGDGAGDGDGDMGGDGDGNGDRGIDGDGDGGGGGDGGGYGDGGGGGDMGGDMSGDMGVDGYEDGAGDGDMGGDDGHGDGDGGSSVYLYRKL